MSEKKIDPQTVADFYALMYVARNHDDYKVSVRAQELLCVIAEKHFDKVGHGNMDDVLKFMEEMYGSPQS